MSANELEIDALECLVGMAKEHRHGFESLAERLERRGPVRQDFLDFQVYLATAITLLLIQLGEGKTIESN
ncbi:MAG: hypothetical protein MI923_01325 [Phycisphaerales bacterium]|nr:hypothetical protein [Phycisphaerales bacterium]